MKDCAIIVAGGKGLRMGTETPKQFLPVSGRPVLMLTIDAFRAYHPQLDIILVLPREQQEYWRRLCDDYHSWLTTALPTAERRASNRRKTALR